jgi:hypothetical protein
MNDKNGIIETLLGATPDRRFKAAPALKRLVTAWPNEALAVEETLGSWVEALGGDLTPYQLGLLEELALMKFLESAVVGKLADNRKVLDDKGGLSPLIQGSRQLSETVARLQDRLREELPKKTPETVDVSELWARAAAPQTPPPAAPESGEETDQGKDTPEGENTDSVANQIALNGENKEGA